MARLLAIVLLVGSAWAAFGQAIDRPTLYILFLSEHNREAALRSKGGRESLIANRAARLQVSEQSCLN